MQDQTNLLILPPFHSFPLPMTSLHDVQRPAASRLLWSLETGSSATSTGLPPRRPLGHANTGLNSIPMSNQMHMKSFAGPPFKDREHFAHPARQFTIEPKTLPVSQKMAIGAIGDGRRSKHSEVCTIFFSCPLLHRCCWQRPLGSILFLLVYE